MEREEALRRALREAYERGRTSVQVPDLAAEIEDLKVQLKALRLEQTRGRSGQAGVKAVNEQGKAVAYGERARQMVERQNNRPQEQVEPGERLKRAEEGVRAAAEKGDVGAVEKLVASLTVKQIGELKSKLGIRASGRKAELTAKVAARAVELLKGKQAEPEPEPEDPYADMDFGFNVDEVQKPDPETREQREARYLEGKRIGQQQQLRQQARAGITPYTSNRDRLMEELATRERERREDQEYDIRQLETGEYTAGDVSGTYPTRRDALEASKAAFEKYKSKLLAEAEASRQRMRVAQFVPKTEGEKVLDASLRGRLGRLGKRAVTVASHIGRAVLEGIKRQGESAGNAAQFVSVVMNRLGRSVVPVAAAGAAGAAGMTYGLARATALLPVLGPLSAVMSGTPAAKKIDSLLFDGLRQGYRAIGETYRRTKEAIPRRELPEAFTKALEESPLDAIVQSIIESAEAEGVTLPDEQTLRMAVMAALIQSQGIDLEQLKAIAEEANVDD